MIILKILKISINKKNNYNKKNSSNKIKIMILITNKKKIVKYNN